MKYFFKVLFVLVLSCAVVFGVYYYTHGKTVPFTGQTLPLTTVTKPAATEKRINKTLLASLEKEDFYLYKNERIVILEHGGKEYEFNNWSSAIADAPPEMQYFNLDSDKEKELVIRAVTGKEQSSGEFVYDIYILDPYSEDGNENYNVVLLSQDTWRTILDRHIIQEVTQLNGCKKYVQLALSVAGNPITYDKATGIATKCGTQAYIKALQDSKGNYLTVNGYSKGKGVYTVEKDKLCLNIDINISYKESSAVQSAGTIYFELTVDGGTIKITKKSMRFSPSEAYAISDPRKTADAPWEYSEQNSSLPTGEGELQWIKYTPQFDSSTITQTLDYSAESTDIKKVSSIKITQSAAILTAAEGFTFSKDAAENGEFSVIINGGKYDIAYTAAVDETGRTLTINFDKSYPREEIEKLDISYGSK